MTETFDAAKQVVRTPVFFASDISDVARPIAIGGTREMIVRGYHREAMFWIAATQTRCQKILAADAPPEVQYRFEPGYQAMLTDLGIAGCDDLLRGAENTRSYLPRLWNAAEAIMESNPSEADNK